MIVATYARTARWRAPHFGLRSRLFIPCVVTSDSETGELRSFASAKSAFTPSPGGYTLYLAIYVKPVSRLTTLYMALIDPFRRLVVYPALGRHAQQRWSRMYA